MPQFEQLFINEGRHGSCNVLSSHNIAPDIAFRGQYCERKAAKRDLVVFVVSQNLQLRHSLGISGLIVILQRQISI
jgi:hypothetical protein